MLHGRTSLIGSNIGKAMTTRTFERYNNNGAIMDFKLTKPGFRIAPNKPNQSNSETTVKGSPVSG